jgi:uncharacterized membrane protein YraQ (UPF0718 family)
MNVGKIFDTTTTIFGLLTLILFLLLWVKEPTVAKTTAQSGLFLFLRYSLLIVFSMMVATMLPALIPKEIIAEYLGGASG